MAIEVGADLKAIGGMIKPISPRRPEGTRPDGMETTLITHLPKLEDMPNAKLSKLTGSPRKSPNSGLWLPDCGIKNG